MRSLNQKMQKDYTAVMYGKSMPSGDEFISSLKRQLIRVQQVKEGRLNTSGQESVSALLTSIIEALNHAPGDIQMNIDNLSISSKNIVITGDTASRENTISLFNAIDQHPRLKTSQNNYDFKAGRDQFRVTILPKETTK